MIVLGLTGSVAMGKSTAAAMFQQLKIPVHDADQAVARLLKKDTKLLKELWVHFPEAWHKKIKTVNKAALAQIIFEDPERKALLESLIHPRVQISEQSFIKKAQRLGQPVVVLDIPLLFETGAEERCDYVAVVSAPFKIQRARALRRPDMTEKRFHQILATQLSSQEKCARADFIIPTGLGHAAAMRRIQHILSHLKEI
jgi:dephospho-CoA kinase